MFYIQDAKFSKSLTTHEAILTAAKGTGTLKKQGAGMFAFATFGGISLVFEDDILKEFLRDNYFTLIVGMDDITNTKSLLKLQELEKNYHPNLIVKAFYHGDSGSLFHPKVIWFKIGDEIRIITGSGNLTEKALRRNREAFTVNSLSGDSLKNLEEYWKLWILENKHNLRDIDDPEVTQKAEINAMRFFEGRPKVRSGKETASEDDDTPVLGGVKDTTEEPEDDATVPEDTSTPSSVSNIIDIEDEEAWVIEDNQEVLVAEIPGSGDRWKQANFSRGVFEDFFGGVAGETAEIRILLRHVNSSGSLEGVEVRPPVSVKSQNYRIELNAASGLLYPSGDARPIGIFVKVSTRTFVYTLVMPESTHYDELINYLNSSMDRVGNKMRRYLTDTKNLKINCPNLVLWQT